MSSSKRLNYDRDTTLLLIESFNDALTHHRETCCTHHTCLKFVMYALTMLLSSEMVSKFTECVYWGEGGGSSVSRVRDFWSGDRGFDPGFGRPIPTGWVGISIMRQTGTEVMVSPLYLCVAARKIVRRQSWNPCSRKPSC